MALTDSRRQTHIARAQFIATNHSQIAGKVQPCRPTRQADQIRHGVLAPLLPDSGVNTCLSVKEILMSCVYPSTGVLLTPDHYVFVLLRQ